MNLKSHKTQRIQDASTNDEELKMLIFKQIEKFVQKYHTHFYPHYRGELYDLTLNIFEMFCRPKKHRDGQVYSELERLDVSKVGGGNWKGSEEAAIATYVQRYVKNRLIDMERTDKQEVSVSETYDEDHPGLTLDRAARSGGSVDGGSDDEVSTGGGGATIAKGMESIVEMLDNPDNWLRARDIFDEMPIEEKKHISRLYKLLKGKHELDPKVVRFLEDILSNFNADEPSETPAVPKVTAKSTETLESAPNAVLQSYKLQNRPAIKVAFTDKESRAAADLDAVIKEMEGKGYEFYRAVGSAIYFFKKEKVGDGSKFVAVNADGKVKKVRTADRRQMPRATFYGPFADEVADSFIQKVKNLQAIGDTEIPKIKGSADLYKFAEKLGIDYLKSNGKPKGTEEIKSLIAEYLWDIDHPGEPMPPQIAPQLINDITSEGKEYVDKTFKSKDWLLQNKINGMRFILVLNPDGSTHMTSRDRSTKTFRYSELDDRVLGLQNLKSPFRDRCILDGEIICENPSVTLPSGITTTSTLQSTVALMHMRPSESLKIQKEIGTLKYKVFDILELNGHNVESVPYEDRAELTMQACEAINKINPHSAIDPLPVIKDYESAWDTFQQYVSQGGEGLILKNRKAPYEQGKRTKGQWKLKGFVGIDAYVTGFTPASDDKQFANLIGGLVFSTHYKGKEVEIAAVSNIPLDVRKAATSHDASGNVILNPDWYGKCAELIGQNFKEGSFRLGSARINEWRDDKKPEDCELLESQIRYDR